MNILLSTVVRLNPCIKKLIIFLLIGFAQQQIFCQTFSLDNFNLQKNKIDKTGFIVLGSWSAANIIYGTIATSGAHGANKYFNQMNALWNTVNLGLSAMGYIAAKREGVLDYEQSLKKQVRLEKTFLFNAGLDLAYITSGLYLNERSKNVTRNSDKFKGYGESVILQGGSLLIFDIIMYSMHKAHGKKLFKLTERVKLTAAGKSIGLLVKL